jgi:hypothetical protein
VRPGRPGPPAGVLPVTVHVGQITSEVVALGDALAAGGAAGIAGAAAGAGGEQSEWEQRHLVEATIERLTLDRSRTATGRGHD